MFQHLWLVAVQQGGRVDAKDEAAVRHGDVAAYALADAYAYTQFFGALTGERLGLGLAGLDLATRELPAAGRFRRIGTLAGEHSAVADDRGADDGPDGVIKSHGGQIARRNGRSGSTCVP